MKNDELFHGESVVSQSNDGIVTLTTQRIRYAEKHHIVSILLSNVTSIEVVRKENKNILYLSIIALIASIGLAGINANEIDPQYELTLIGVAISVVALVFYFLSRIGTVSICSNGGHKIEFTTAAFSKNELMVFVNKVEKQMLITIERSLAPSFVPTA